MQSADDMLLQGRRMSQRSVAKRVKYNVDLTDEDASGDDDDANETDDSAGGLQKLKSQPCAPAAAKSKRLQLSQEGTASQQEAEPLSSAVGTASAGRRQSMTAAGSGRLQAVPEEAEEDPPGEPDMTQKSTGKGSQKAQQRQVRPQPCTPQACYLASLYPPIRAPHP